MALRIFYAGIAAFLVMLAFFALDIAYAPYSHWDIGNHFMGGMWSGFIGAWFLAMATRPLQSMQILIFVLICGIAVELLEYVLGLTYHGYLSYAADTTKDLIIDVIGGYAAIIVIKRFV